MLHDVVRALRAAPSISGVAVLSRDAAAAREASRLGAAFLQEPPGIGDLNAAVRLAQEARADADALLVVPGDLPLISAADIIALTDALALARAPSVVIAPSRDGGTNGLLLRPPGVMAPAYGPGSAARHQAAARAAGAVVAVVETARWALDIDTPEDLTRARALPGGEALETVRYLRSTVAPPGRGEGADSLSVSGGPP